jgi:Trypsin-like peptidase domain
VTVPTRRRVVEIEVDLGEETNPRWRYGSGLLVGHRTVLTAAHVVAGAKAIAVRGSDKRSLDAKLDAELVGDPDRLDLALLELPGLEDPLPPVDIAIVDRDTRSGTFVEGCWSVGYPAFQEVERDANGRSLRETAQVGGRVPPLSGLVEGLLTLEVTASPKELPDSGTLGESQWSGMSGAGVFAGDALIGVIAEHSVRRGPSDITVTPLEFLSEAGHAPPNASRWWAALNVADPSSLIRLPERVSARGEPAAAYRFVENRLSGRRVCSAVWNHAGSSYAVANDTRVELYDASATYQTQFPAPEACYLAGRNVQWAPDDRKLAVLADQGELNVIDVETAHPIDVGSDIGMQGLGQKYSWSRDGSTIAIATLDGVFFAPADGGESRLVVPRWHSDVSMSPVEDIFAVSLTDNDGPLFQVRGTSDNQPLATVGRAADTGWATTVDFDPTGQLLALGFEDFGIEVWSLPTRSRIATLEAPSGVISDVRWSSSGGFLMATSHERQVVRVYGAEKWQLLGELKPHETSRRGVGVSAGSIAPDGSVLVVPQGERGIDVFELAS